MLSESGTRLWEEQHSLLPLSEKGYKMLIVLLAGRWCKSPIQLVYTARYAERKPGLDKSQGCWRCIILYYPLISMYNQKYKRLSRTIKDVPVSQTSFSNWFIGNLTPPCRIPLSPFLPLPPSPFQAEFPSGAWKLSESTYLPWLLRPTWEGAQGRAPSAIQVGSSGLT